MRLRTDGRNRLLLAWLLAGFFLLTAGICAHHVWAQEGRAAVHLQRHSYEINTGEPVIGAKLHLLDSSGGLVAEIITDGTEIVFEAELIAGETYTLREVEAPPGYVLAADIVFTVSTDGSIDEIVMKDDTTKVEVWKLDGRDNPLPGVPMRIVDAAGNTVEEWITTEEAHLIVAKLIAGATYTLQEVEAPEGYIKADDQTFTVSEDGSIDRLTVYNIRNSTPVTGDYVPLAGLFAVAGAAAVGIVIARKKKEA